MYSISEAKAKLSEILRQVRAGTTIRISRRGEPIAEIRQIERRPSGLEGRVQELSDRGVLICSSEPKAKLAPIRRRPGALKRFLAERNG